MRSQPSPRMRCNGHLTPSRSVPAGPVRRQEQHTPRARGMIAHTMEDLVTAPWLRRLIIAALLAAFVLLGFRVMDPFIVPLVWAGILAFASWPAYRWLRDKCRGHTTVAAVLMTSAMTAAVIAPLAWLAVVLRVELTHAWHETQTLLTGGVQLPPARSEEHTSELQSRRDLVCRLLLEKKKKKNIHVLFQTKKNNTTNY